MAYRKIHSLTNDGINEEILAIGVRGGLAEAMEVTQPAVGDSDRAMSSHTRIPNLLPLHGNRDAAVLFCSLHSNLHTD